MPYPGHQNALNRLGETHFSCAVCTKALMFSFSAKDHKDTQVFFYLWIVFYVISSCYTLIWDLKMDWGLFDKNAGENTFLREEIVYPQKVCMQIANM